MRIQGPIAVAVFAVLTISGCGSSAPSKTDQLYAVAVQQADPDDFGAIPVDKLASTLSGEGPDICTRLKKGGLANAVAYVKLGYSTKEAEALIGSAVPAYCPGQKTKLGG
ncbi:DUF732 domain-containing protein [Streptantibioticus silvisoli]|uniref:DUF732 domain-containing protein n=1 Tax=Streptantibioticus silvisoli TaxID=2705255 RepID=A0ABT6W4N1_9ACTN|nr:DUF732 domain-containing protein [Streptantibioticus silvisoli]MDI5965715.1 DUF732 domain-containing protein [Streptantibioticus silvisoli]